MGDLVFNVIFYLPALNNTQQNLSLSRCDNLQGQFFLHHLIVYFNSKMSLLKNIKYSLLGS